MRGSYLSILLIFCSFQVIGATAFEESGVASVLLTEPQPMLESQTVPEPLTELELGSSNVVQTHGADLSDLVRYPDALKWLYKVDEYDLVWNDASLVEHLTNQIELLADAQISPTFNQQLSRIHYVLEVGDVVDIDLIMMDSLLLYMSYLEQLPEYGQAWLFRGDKLAEESIIDLPEPSMNLIMEVRNEMSAQTLNEYIAQSRSPFQISSGFDANYKQLKKLRFVETLTKKQSRAILSGRYMENKEWLLERLSIAGVDITQLDSEAEDFDHQLQIAIQAFQKIHGLKQDGKIDKRTLRWLNKSPEQRVHKLALNAERSRLWERDRSNVVMVNVPDYRVTYWKEGEALFESKVIVGRTRRKTPVMSMDLDSVILNPTWNIPWKIMVKDIIPKAKKDPMYLVRQKIQIIRSWHSDEVIDFTTIDWKNINPYDFPYKMRQASGQKNALGRYKFHMPNTRAIYLHDTPTKNLFGKEQRAFSSGCVRVEDADEFASVLFKSQGIETRLLAKQQSARDNNAVSLREIVPVHIIYQTAWLEEGVAYYRDDIYSYDN